MRDKLLLLVLKYTRWRYKKPNVDLVDTRYIDALINYMELTQVAKRYKPTIGMRTFIDVEHRTAERLITQFSKIIEHMKRGEYVNPPVYEAKTTSLVDWLVDENARPYNVDQYITLLLSYYRVYHGILHTLRFNAKTEELEYYRRKTNRYLKDLVTLLETILDITH